MSDGLPLEVRRALAVGLAGILIPLFTPGSAAADTVLARASAQDLAVSGDTLYWSRKEGPHRYRLMKTRAGITSRLPLRPDALRFAPSAGTDAAGAPVLVYARCGRPPRCRSLHAFSPSDNRERRLPVRAGGRCELFAPSLDRGVLAFGRYGRCAERGIWLRYPDGRTTRLTRHADACCTAVIGDVAAWIGVPERGLVHLAVASAGGRPFELFRHDNTHPLDAYVGRLSASGGRLYWSVSTWRGRRARVATDARVYRATPTPFADCEATSRQLPTRAQELPVFAVDEGGLRYATRGRILLADSPPLVFGAEHSPFAPFTARLGRGCWAF